LSLHDALPILEAARVLDVLEHLLAGDALGAAGVGAGAGEHLPDLGAAERADHDLAAAAGLGVTLPGELADHLHRAEAHDDGLRRLEALIDGLVLSFELGDIFLELREWMNWHGRKRKPKSEKRK